MRPSDDKDNVSLLSCSETGERDLGRLTPRCLKTSVKLDVVGLKGEGDRASSEGMRPGERGICKGRSSGDSISIAGPVNPRRPANVTCPNGRNLLMSRSHEAGHQETWEKYVKLCSDNAAGRQGAMIQ